MNARPKRAWFGLSLITLLSLCAFAFSQTFPNLSGRVVDDAGILNEAIEASLSHKLADLEARTTDQIVVVTLKSLQGFDIADYGYRLGRHWQIGQKGKDNGALLIVAPNDRKVRIEVGYGLEGSLTDAVTRLIIEHSVLPRFRANDFSGGVERAIDDIIAVLTGQADEYKQRAARRPETATPAIDLGTIFILALVALVIIRSISLGTTSRRRRRGLWGAGPIFFPGSGSSWGSGSSSGGFSGGGGSFGGGGSSGSW